MQRLSILLATCFAGFVIAGCSNEAEKPKATPPATKPDLGTPGDASEMLPDEPKATEGEKKPADAAKTPADTPSGGPDLKPNPAPTSDGNTEKTPENKSEPAPAESAAKPSGKTSQIDDTVNDPEEE